MSSDDDRTAMEKYYDRNNTPDDPTDNKDEVSDAEKKAAARRKKKKKQQQEAEERDSTTNDSGSNSSPPDLSSPTGTSPGPNERDDLPTGGSDDTDPSRSDDDSEDDDGTASPSGTSPGPGGRDDFPTGGDSGADDGGDSQSSPTDSPSDTDDGLSIPGSSDPSDGDDGTSSPSGTSPGPGGRDDLPTGGSDDGENQDSGGASPEDDSSGSPEPPSDPTDSDTNGDTDTTSETDDGGSGDDGSSTDTGGEGEPETQDQETDTEQSDADADDSGSESRVGAALSAMERWLLNNPNESAGGRTGADVAEEENLSDEEVQEIGDEMGGSSPVAEGADPPDPSDDLTATESELGYDPTNPAEAIAATGSADRLAVDERAREQARTIEQQVIEQNPAIDDPSEVAIALTEVDGETQLQPRLTDEGEAAVEQFQREQAIQQVQEQTDDDLEPGEDIVVEQTDDGVQARVTEQYRREQAAAQITEQVVENSPLQDADIDPDDLARAEDGFTLSEDAAERLDEQQRDVLEEAFSDLPAAAERQIEFARRQEIDEQRATMEDVPVSSRRQTLDLAADQAESQTPFSSQRQSINLAAAQGEALSDAEQDVRQQAIEQVQEQTEADLDPGEDFVVETEVTDEGVRADVELTDEGRREEARRSGDIFSGAVSAIEDGLTETRSWVHGDDTRRVEFQGEGSVINVAADEARNDEVDLTADLGPVSDAGDAASDAGEFLQRRAFGPFADASGDVAEMSATAFDQVISGERSIVLGPKSVNPDEEALEELQQQFRDLGRAPENEVQGPSTVERAGQGVGSGAAILNIPAVAGTVVDAGEVGVAGAQATASGRGGEFAQQAGGQAALIAGRATESAATNPAQFAGMLVGGVGVSAAAIRGAQALAGARAARATSFAIQPGEEIAISAARSGVIPSRAAQAVPGVRRDSVESDARVDTTESANSGGDDGILSSPVQRARQKANEVRERSPSVRTTTTEDGRVSVSDPLQRDMRIKAAEVEENVARRLVSARNTVADLPDTVTEATARGTVGFRNARQDLRIGLQREVGIRAANADSATVETLVRARNLRSDAPDMAERAFRRGRVRAMNARQDIETRVRQQAAVTAADIESTILGTGVRAQNLRADAPDMVDRALRRGRVGAMNTRQDATLAARQRLFTAGANIDSGLVEGLVRGRNRLADAPSLEERLASGLVRSRNTIQDGRIGVGQQLQALGINVEQPVLSTAVQARNLRADAPDLIDTALRRGRVRAMNARQDIGIEARQQFGSGANAAETAVFSRAIQLQNARADLPDTARDTALAGLVRGSNLRQDLSNAGIEIVPGKPARRSFDLGDDVEIEIDGPIESRFGTAEADTDEGQNPFTDSDGDGEDAVEEATEDVFGESDGDDDTITLRNEVEQDAGDGTVVIRQQEVESRPRDEGRAASADDSGTDFFSGRVEVSGFDSEASDPYFDVDDVSASETVDAAGISAGDETAGALDDDLDGSFGMDFRSGVGSDLREGVGSDLRSDVGQGFRSDLGGELENRPRFESSQRGRSDNRIGPSNSELLDNPTASTQTQSQEPTLESITREVDRKNELRSEVDLFSGDEFEERSGLGGFDIDSETFDTGVVQSLDELNLEQNTEDPFSELDDDLF